LAAGWILAALACAGCGAGRPSNSDAPRVQEVVADEVTLVLEVPAGPRSEGRPAGASAPLLATPRGGPGDRRGYEYEFCDDPLEAGAPREPGSKGPCSTQCAPWSSCEVKTVLELHKELFRDCLPGRGATAREVAIRFVAHAVINQDGVVREADVEGVDPPTAGAEACAEGALGKIPFPIETYDVTVVLTVPIRVMTSAR
jgi:hypothetical protein